MGKKKWIAPKLIILIRSNQTENVLAYCKESWGQMNIPSSGPNNVYLRCRGVLNEGCLNACQGQSES